MGEANKDKVYIETRAWKIATGGPTKAISAVRLESTLRHQ